MTATRRRPAEAELTRRHRRRRRAARTSAPASAQRQLVIINWSGEYDKVMPTLIMSSAAAASGYKSSVFLTFWGLLPFVKD